MGANYLDNRVEQQLSDDAEQEKLEGNKWRKIVLDVSSIDRWSTNDKINYLMDASRTHLKGHVGVHFENPDVGEGTRDGAHNG